MRRAASGGFPLLKKTARLLTIDNKMSGWSASRSNINR